MKIARTELTWRSHLVQCRDHPLFVDDELWGVVDPGFKCVVFDLLAAAAMADVCVVMRREGKGTGQMDRVPAAADVPVATEKKFNSPRCQARFSSRCCEWGRRQVRQAIAVASCRCCSTAVQVVERPGLAAVSSYADQRDVSKWHKAADCRAMGRSVLRSRA